MGDKYRYRKDTASRDILNSLMSFGLDFLEEAFSLDLAMSE